MEYRIIREIPSDTIVYVPDLESAKELLQMLHAVGYMRQEGRDKISMLGLFDPKRRNAYEIYPEFMLVQHMLNPDNNCRHLSLDEFKDGYAQEFDSGETFEDFSLCGILSAPGIDTSGEKFYSPAFGIVTVDELKTSDVAVKSIVDQSRHILDSKGRAENGDRCQLYPTNALYERYPLNPERAWAAWLESKMKYGVTVAYKDDEGWVDAEKHLSFATTANYNEFLNELKALIELWS